MGRRREKNNQRFFYDGYLQVADNTGNAYAWDVTEPIATRPLVWTKNDISSYYDFDGNKNVSEVIAADGSVSAHYEYASFGAVIAHRGMSATENPWRFSCERAEDEMMTVYYNYRHYDPVAGRWLSRDPIEEQGGLALYRFCGNNGVDSFDNLGNNPAIIVIEGVASLKAAEIVSIAGLLCAGSTECVAIAIKGIKDILSSLVSVGKKIQCIRCRFGNHDAHHRFTRFRWGVPPWKYCWMKHLQLNCYIKGVKGTDRVLRLGYGPCYKNKYGKPNGETH